MPLVMKTRNEAPKCEAFLHFFAPLVELGILGGCWDGSSAPAGRREQREREDGDQEGAHTAAQPSAAPGRDDARRWRSSTTSTRLLARARRLAEGGRRAVLGIAGPPGGGKSTLAERVVDALGDRAAFVPMDGFHLAQPELVRLGRRDRMGAPDTFDAAGYVALLERLRAHERRRRLRARVPARDRGADRRRDRRPARRSRWSSPRATTCSSTTATGPACGRCSTRPGTSRWTRTRGSSWLIQRHIDVRQDARRGARLGDALRPGQRRGRRGDARARRRRVPPRHARRRCVAGSRIGARASATIPAPTVSFVPSSIRTNAPVTRLAA